MVAASPAAAYLRNETFYHLFCEVKNGVREFVVVVVVVVVAAAVSVLTFFCSFVQSDRQTSPMSVEVKN